MEIFLQAETWIALLTLTFLEIVLGIDNVIFISIISNKLPQEKQGEARNIGLILALLLRIGLLFGITWIVSFKEPLFTILNEEISGRDLILMIGGLFLLAKSTREIHHKVEGETSHESEKQASSFISVIIQIVLLDMVFSFDSILTAIGLTDELTLMIIAVVISIGIMMAFSKRISDFISDHPTLEILALSFLILIGFMLMIESLNFHVPKGYIYFAVFFSLIVELINMKMRKSRKPVHLRKKID